MLKTMVIEKMVEDGSQHAIRTFEKYSFIFFFKVELYKIASR